MKYLRILIVVLILVVVGIAGYYVYLLSTGQKAQIIPDFTQGIAAKPLATTGPLTETPRPFISTPKPNTQQVAYIVTDYTSAQLAPDDYFVSKGIFQSADVEDTEIKGVKYVFVVGILKDNANLSRIHLTQEEYDNKMKDALTNGNVGPGAKVILTLRPGLSDITPDTTQ